MKLIKGVNDIATLFPDLIKEWDFGLNEKTPDSFTKGSNSVAHWICNKGHKYTAQICERVRGSGCPFCTGKKASAEYHNDLLSINPELAKEWNYEKNNPLTPDVVSPGSSKKFGGSANKDMNGELRFHQEMLVMAVRFVLIFLLLQV